MRIGFAGPAPTPEVAELTAALRGLLATCGHQTDASPDEADLVFNLTGAGEVASHWRRRHVQQFGVSLLGLTPDEAATRPVSPTQVLRVAYPALLRTLSNAVVTVDDAGLVLVTPEMGVRPLPNGSPEESARGALEALLPMATARFALKNRFVEDLPAEPPDPHGVRAALAEAGRRLGGLGLLPSPVPLEDVLSEEDRRLLRTLYGLQQVSYGNASARNPDGGFWMSGRGVDKSRLEVVGRDVFLVSGFDREEGVIDVRVPPGATGGRVSVDAIEHAMLYDAFPAVGAIVHVHAWIPGVACTRQSYPCGTVELADEVLRLVSQQPDPACAVVGLRNHGLTLTGSDLPSIFGRMEGRLVREVPPT